MSLGPKPDPAAVSRAHEPPIIAPPPTLPSILTPDLHHHQHGPEPFATHIYNRDNLRPWPLARPHDIHPPSGTPSAPVSVYRHEALPSSLEQLIPKSESSSTQGSEAQYSHSSLKTSPTDPDRSGSSLKVPEQRAVDAPVGGHSSPKAQRKGKGHVASACVPCKRAHLRCDGTFSFVMLPYQILTIYKAQRPCSRCVSNGKEDCCIDVQHKKRGRPRLREDRDTHFEPGQFQSPRDSARAPASIYSASGQPSATYDGRPRQLSHTQPPEYQPSSATAGASANPRYLDHVLSTPSTPGLQPLPPPSRTEEMAYVNMNLKFVKASPTFLHALSLPQDLVGRSLGDIFPVQEGERIRALHTRLIEEQKRHELNHLPPILDRGEDAIQALGFAREHAARVSYVSSEYWPVIAVDGQIKLQALKLGLVKEGSFYFIAVLLDTQGRHAPSGDFAPRPFATHTETSRRVSAASSSAPLASYDHARRRSSNESKAGYSTHQVSNHVHQSRSPHISPQQVFYSATGPWQGHETNAPSQVPRSELPRAANFPAFSPYQLPPIRSQMDNTRPTVADEESQRDSKRRRVTIGGLLDTPKSQEKHV